MSSFFVLGPVQKQVNHFVSCPREIGCFRFRSLNSCRSRPRPTSVESGASSSHHVMGCAPIEATWLLDRPPSRAMTLLCSTCFWRGSKGEASLDRQQPLFLGDADGRERPAVELKIIGFDAVAEDDAVLSHLRYDGHSVS